MRFIHTSTTTPLRSPWWGAVAKAFGAPRPRVFCPFYPEAAECGVKQNEGLHGLLAVLARAAASIVIDIIWKKNTEIYDTEIAKNDKLMIIVFAFCSSPQTGPPFSRCLIQLEGRLFTELNPTHPKINYFQSCSLFDTRRESKNGSPAKVTRIDSAGRWPGLPCTSDTPWSPSYTILLCVSVHNRTLVHAFPPGKLPCHGNVSNMRLNSHFQKKKTTKTRVNKKYIK
jgi:hypothetical protein